MAEPYVTRIVDGTLDDLVTSFPHTGPRVFPLGDRLVAAPVSALWS